MKTICLVGVNDVEGSTNISQAKAFMEQGFSIIPINYRSLISKYGMETFEDILVSTVKKYRPYLTFFAKCNGINPNIVKECSKYSHTWLWNPDPISTIKQVPEVIEHAKNVDFASCTGGGVAEWFEEQGVKKCYTIFDGLDTDIFKPVIPFDSLKADISLIGTKTKEREKVREALIEAGIDAKFYGDGYQYKAVNLAFSQVCSSSKFMLSINSSTENITDYFSNRLLRYMGCGACVLHYDPTETLKKYFKDGEEILFFKTTEELIDKIKNTDDATAKKIGEAGRKKVLETYTWDHTINKILDIIGKVPKKQVLIKYHHGLGDIIALTPQLRYFYENNYEVTLMARKEVVDSHLLDNCPYVKEIIVIPNPWRDKELRTKEEYKKIEEENTLYMESLSGYDLKLNVDHKNIPINIPKSMYNSQQCKTIGLEDYQKELFIPECIEKEVRKEIQKRFPNGYIFKHTFVPNHTNHSVEIAIKSDLPIFDTYKEILKEDINYTFAFIKYATKIVVSSSVMAQAAEALGRNIDILNFGNMDYKVLPDYYLVNNIYYKGQKINKEEWYNTLEYVIKKGRLVKNG